MQKGTQELKIIKVSDIRFVKDLYPRLNQSETAVNQYRESIDKLPPIVLARDGILVDGYHRWKAHQAENIVEIKYIDLGNLSDIEIIKESLIRNSNHGYQLTTVDKKSNANKLYTLLSGEPDEKYDEISKLLSLSKDSARKYCKEARQSEKEKQQSESWDLWLDCWTQQAIADKLGLPRRTISDWLGEFGTNSIFAKVPNSTPDKPWGDIQHFDVWNFASSKNDTGYFGAMPTQVVENLLWLYTAPGQIVFDPFAGSGTTIKIAKNMGRRVWSSDRKIANEMLPIHKHDITTSWPEDAPGNVDFILLDPPYWKQAAGRYSNDPDDLGNMNLDDFYNSWIKILTNCNNHLNKTGYLAFIVSPAEDKENDIVVDLAFDMYEKAKELGFKQHRRIIVTYSTQQATGQQVTWARENKKLLKLYRDLIILKRG